MFLKFYVNNYEWAKIRTYLKLFYTNIFRQKYISIFYMIYVNIPRLSLCLK